MGLPFRKFDCLLVRLGIATSASSTGPMLVATHDLHPMGTCRTSSVGSGYRTSPANCDDPIRGSGPGEIVFRHMSVVQRGVQSRASGRLPRRKSKPCTQTISTHAVPLACALWVHPSQSLATSGRE